MNKKILTDKELIALTILSYDRPGFPQPEDEDDVNFERQQREAYEFLELDKSNRGWDEDSDIANIAETKIRNSHGLENSIADPRLDFFDGTTSNVVQQIAEVQAKVFVNAADKVVVIGVQGSDFPNIPDSDTYSNWKSDIWNSGASEYKKIEPLVDEILKQVKQEYPGFTVVVSGHSLAGGVAQTYALKNSLDFAILDSLPIPPDSIRDVFGGDEKFLRTVEEWRANGHQGRSVIVENEIATTFYSDIKREFYLDNDPTILPNSYGPYGDYYSSRLSVILSGPPGLIPFSVLRGLDHAGGVAWDLVKDAPIDFKGRAVTDPSLWPVTQTTNLSDGSTLITRGDNYRAVISEDGKEFRFEIGDTVIYQTATSLWQKNPDGSVVVNKINGAGEWELRNYTPEQVRNEYINDPFDPENDGVGVWDGTTAGMDISDLDSQFDDANIPGLVWGRETVSRFKTGNVNDSMVDPITGIPKYLDPASANSVRDWSNLTKSEFDNLAEAGVRAGQQGLALITAIQNGKELTALDAGIKLALELDHALDVGGDGFISDAGSSNLATASSAITFANAIDNQNWGRALSSGYQLGDKLEFFDGNASSARGVSAITSAYNLYSSIQNGNTFGSVVSAVTLYNSLSSTPILGGGSYLGYVQAGLQLLDGDVEGAAMSAATTYLSTVAVSVATEVAGGASLMQAAAATANPYIIAAAAVVTAVIAIANSDEPDPEASLRFSEDANGNILFDTNSNKTGDGLEQQLSGLGGVLAQRIQAFENSLPEGIFPDNEVDISTLPEIISLQNPKTGATELRLVGGTNMGGGVSIIVGGAAELINILPGVILNSNFQDSWITSVSTLVNENGQTITQIQADPFNNAPSFSIAQGTGIFVGGGNVGGNKDLVFVKDNQIRSLAPLPLKPVVKELADVTKTWRLDKSVFEGPGGQLLAAGIATGLLSMNEVSAATGSSLQERQPPPSSIDIEAYRRLLNDPKQNVIATEYGRVSMVPIVNTAPIAPSEVYQTAFSANYDRSYVDLNTTPGSAGVVRIPGPLPVDIPLFTPSKDQVVADQQADLIRELARPVQASSKATAPETPVDPVTHTEKAEAAEIKSFAALTGGRIDQLLVLEDREVFTSIDALLANDIAGVTFIGLSSATHGNVNINAAGDIQFIPDSNFAGEAGFSYLIEDANGQQQTVTVQVIVENVNDAPEANDDVITVAANSVLDLQSLLANDTDPDNDGLSIVAVSQVNNGVVSLAANGRYQFIPDAGFTGETQLTYVVEDSNGSRSIAAAQLLVGNNAAASTVAVSDAVSDVAVLSGLITGQEFSQPDFNLVEDESRLFSATSLLGLPDDAINNVPQILNVRLLDNRQGSIYLTPEGDVQFTPTPNLTGEVIFTYDIDDGVTVEAAQTQLKIWPQNDAPLLQDDQVQGVEDSTRVLSGADLLANDRDIEGDSLRLVGIWGSSAEAEARYDAATDLLSFTPPDNYFGDAWVDFLVEDSQGAWAVERAEIAIANVDDPAIAIDDTVSLLEDEARLVLAEELMSNDVNLDLEVLRINAIDTSLLTDGTAELLADGNVRFIPAANYAGNQTLMYELIDETGNTSMAQVTLVVQQVNDAPIVQVSAATAVEDQLASYSYADLLANASDIEGDAMQVVGVLSRFGTVGIDDANARITFQANVDFNSAAYGGPAVVEYLVADEFGAATWGTMNIDVAAVNDAPRVFDDTLLAWAGGPASYANTLYAADLLANDTDVDGDTLSVNQVAQGVNGSVTLDQNSGLIRYTANAGFSGRDSFTYRVNDGVANSVAQGTVVVDVINNTAPLASDFAMVGAEDTRLRFDWTDFSANVSDMDLLQSVLPESLQLVSVSNAVNGSVSMNADGTVTFDPQNNFNSAQNQAVASFDYVVRDIVGNTSQATVSINLTPVNDDPVANPDGLPSIDEDSAGLVFSATQLLLNDTDIDRDANGIAETLTITTSNAIHGSVTDLGNGLFRYTPDANFNGLDRFNYTVFDGNGGSDSSYAEINVRSVNDNPVAEVVTGAGNDRDRNLLSGVLDRASDVDGDSLSLRITGVSGGVSSATVVGGNIAWRGGSHGRGTIFYDVLDGNGGVAISQANVNIVHANNPPVVIALQTDYYERADVQTRFNNGFPESRFHVEVHGFMQAYDVDGSISSYLPGDNNPPGFRVFSNGRWSVELGWSYWFQNSFDQSFNYSIRAYDNDGASVTGNFSVTVRVNAGDPSATVIAPPLLFDLDGNGFELASYQAGSLARFDVDGDGKKELTSWMAGGDGLLAIDINNDGVINQTNEISFVSYVEGTKTDLEGLHFFDTDRNGELSANDSQWEQFGIWIDGNADGTNDEGEWQTLDDIGIAAIQLNSDGNTEALDDGNTLFGSGQFTWEDGSTGKFADLGLSYQDEPEIEVITSDVTFDDLPMTDEDEGLILEVSEDVEIDGLDHPFSLTNSDEKEQPENEIKEADKPIESATIIGDSPERLPGDLPENTDSRTVSSTKTSTDASKIEPGLPDDAELDRMALQDVAAIVSQAPAETITPEPDLADSLPAILPTIDPEEDQQLVA